MAKQAANTIKALRLLNMVFSFVVGNDFEQMKSHTLKNTGASISWALRMF